MAAFGTYAQRIALTPDIPLLDMSDYGQDAPTTFASFSPQSISTAPSATKTRSAIIVHQKTPLLVATPPQITRALAHSYPFLLPLNRVAGLVTWTSGDSWESFLMLSVFWAVVLYGDVVLQWAGPLLLVISLIAGMYVRRFSPLSTDRDELNKQKSLDEIVEALTELTSRCNILLEPLLDLTDFLSTQQTATSATTRQALTVLFLRILIVSPFWTALSVWPLNIITTRRYFLTAGTIFLTYHSRPARVLRVLLWRSKIVRGLCAKATGLEFATALEVETPTAASAPKRSAAETKRRSQPAGVRFTFSLYENQRKWIGLGWTNSLFAYERGPWTDEQLNNAKPKDEFTLPVQEGSTAKWRWVEGSRWRIEDEGDTGGWVYSDNKWGDQRRGKDGWNKYTRRRKWYRDAELVDTGEMPEPKMKAEVATGRKQSPRNSIDEEPRRRKGHASRESSLKSVASGRDDRLEETGDREAERARNSGWGLGDEARMGLG